MHEQTCKTHLDATHALIPALANLPMDIRELVARMLQDDVDLLSAAAVQTRALTAELVNASTTVRESAECLRAVVAHLLQVKVELLSPVVFSGEGKGAGPLRHD